MKQSVATLHRPGRFFAIAALLLPATLLAQTPAAQAPSVRLRPAAELSGAADLPRSSAAGRALASADFDEDGVPDLVTGYATADGGRVTVQRGNIDAIYPNSAEAKARRERGEFTTAAFHPAPASLALAEAADFAAAGDFDADGHWDIVAAARGGTKLYWMRGDGRGNFGAAEAIELGGSVTALAAGETNRVDGLTDVAIGIVAANGAHALVFEAAEGALRRAPETFALSAPVNALVLGQLDDEPAHDLAIASGSEVVIVQGRDRKLSLSPGQQAHVRPAAVTRRAFETEVLSIALGDFAGDVQQELAVLTADSVVSVLGRQLNTATDARDRASDAALRMPVDALATRLLSAKVSAGAKDDLLVFGGSHNMQIITTQERDKWDAASKVTIDGESAMKVASTVAAEGAVTAVLPLRLNADALNDLVVLNDDRAVVIETHGGAFVVNTTATSSDKDRGDGICADDAGACSFAAAIEEANAHPGADTIHFNVPGDGVPVVSPKFGQLITDPVTIDGTTQPGGRVAVVVFGPPGSSTHTLTLNGGNSVVRGLALYPGDNVVLYQINISSSGNIIEGNYIGFRADGTVPPGIPSPAQGGGSCIGSTSGGSNNLIGGTTAAARNVISNCRQTVDITGGAGNRFQGNYIGTNPAGTAALANFRGIVARDAGFALGGTAPGAGNVISATGDPGAQGPLQISGTSSVVVQANRFGTTADGMQPIANGAATIEIFNNEPVTIGGTTPAARNLLSASPWGIRIRRDSGGATVIQGNYVGTNAAGTAALPNLESGILLDGTRAVVIGGTASGAGNLISGNAKNGLDVSGGEVVVQGNLIGTDVSGTAALPNQESGMHLDGSDNAQVGGTTAGARNVLSGNAKHGLIVGNATANPGRIQGNLIGVNIFGTGALGNGQHGIHSENGGGYLIGGTEPGAGNIIAFNGGAGIASSFRDFLGGAILSNSIFANRGVGLDRNGDGATTNDNQRYSQTPVITSVTTSGAETVISGNLRTTTFGPQGPFTIQFFSNTNPDPSGYGEGQTLIGETTITAGQSVAVPFSATVPAVPPGRYLSAVAIGRHDTQNNGQQLTSEFSYNVRAPGDPRNNPLTVTSLSPALAGNLGDATVTLFGEGIAEGATVVLRRAGLPDIGAQSLVISATGAGLQATFALAGQTIGQYDIVVTNPDGTSFVLGGSFQIVQGVDADVWVDVVGRGNARPGQPQTYQIVFGNRANTDAYGMPLNVSMPPGTAFKILSTTGFVTLNDIDPNHEVYDEGEDISEYDSFLDFDDARVVLFIVPVIPAGTTGSIVIQMTFPDEGEGGTVLAEIGEPMLESTLPPATGFAARQNDASPMATPAPGIGERARNLRDRYRKELGDRHIKPNGDIDTGFYEKQKADAQRAFEENPSNETRRARDKADAQLVRALGAQGVVSTAKGAKDLVDAKNKVVDGPAGWVKDKVKGWVLDKAFKSLQNIGSAPEIAKDFYKVMREAIKRNTPKPVLRVIRYLRSRDPNDKAGSPGRGSQHYITGARPIPYAIFFENIPAATAPAQVVVITDQLDTARLDLTTFQLGAISFGENTLVTPPPNLTEWTTDVDLRPGNNLLVRISAALDKVTGIVTWRFVSIDPDTNQPTEDPLAGFLPPNKTAPKGEGAVSFIISPRSNQADGTEIRNKARIIFDKNAHIDTPEWLNTIDHTPPTSEVLALPATTAAVQFEVQWSGSDATAGVAYYTIFVSENGGQFTPWLVNTTATSALFEGRPGTTYTFYSVAEDGAGNREAIPIAADTGTTTATGQLLNISTRMRVQGGDNVLIGGLIITGNEPKRVILRAIGPSLAPDIPGALPDPVLELYQAGQLIASNDDWRDSQPGEIEASTIPPGNELESAIVQTLPPGFYTAVLRGKGDATGIAVVESYDLNQGANSQLANISSRGFVEAGDNVMIGGVIAGGSGGADTRVLVRAIGPSLANAGVSGALSDPTLELRDPNGAVIRANDNWQETQQAEIVATTIPPAHAAESAIVATLRPGFYTAVVRGKNGGTGIGLVEVYNVP